MRVNFEAGKAAFYAGKTEADNPFICGTTKLGAPKFSDFDAGCEWADGFRADQQRIASRSEVEEATRLTDVSQFRRRYRRER